MSAVHLVDSDDTKQLKPLVQQLENEGKLEVIEDSTVPNYYKQQDGHLYVLRRIK